LPYPMGCHTVAVPQANGETNPMPTPRELAVADLRRSIDVLPERTRKAMLVGLQNNTVITGAFAGSGGICPMMAAHREGGRTTCVSFPEAWDKFTGVYGRAICRPATQYEVALLRAEIEQSLVPYASPLAEAIAEHTAMVEGRRRRDRLFAGKPVDLGGAIDEHRSTARRRRSDEATDVGLDWLFEETLVLPDDFGTETAPEPEVQPDFDFDAADRDVYAR
jgi:hypothetical protein